MQAAARGNAAPDPVARAVMRVIDAPDTPVPAVLLVAPHRFVPYAINLAGDAPSARAVAVATGVLWDDGTRALVPMAAMAHARRIWVRNGLGQTVAAKYLQAVSGTDLAVLELAVPLSRGDVQWARRDPFAGSPGFVADYPTVQQAAPSWPRLRHGFLGGATLTSSVRHLGITLAAGSQGGAVFDKYGHVAGFAIPAMAGGAVLIPVSQLRNALVNSQLDARAQPADATVAFDEGYEQAMRMTLQVITAT